MRRLFYLVVFCFSSYSLSLSAERGMATVYDTHQSHKLFVSLIHIHYNLESSLPVEIWYSESDITKSDIDRFSQFEFVKMRSIPQNRKKDLLTVLDLCSFDEVIWFLPNIAFFYDPGLLFEDSWYKKTGAFFFNRQERLKHNKKEKVKKNKSDIITLSQKLEPYLNNIPFNIATKIFEKQKRFVSRYELIFSDFSLLVIDKISHRKNVLRAIDLTRDPFFISLKQNDLLWMAIVMNGCPFHQNFGNRTSESYTRNSW